MKILIEILACIGGVCLISSVAVILGSLAQDIKHRKAESRLIAEWENNKVEVWI